MRGLRTSVVLGLAAGLLLPGTTLGTTSVSYSPSTGLLITGDAASEEMRLILFSGSSFEIAVANGQAGVGCDQISGTTVRCRFSGFQSIAVTANLGDGDDSFFYFPQPPDGPSVGALINGGGGNDQLDGGSGDDVIDGGPGDDTLRGGGRIDVLEGGEGNDVFTGDLGGTDTLRGGAGNDVLLSHPNGSSRSADLFDGGPGLDVADYSVRTTAVTLKVSLLPTPMPDDGAPGEGDDLDNVETLIGGKAGDTLEVATSIQAPLSFVSYTLRGNGGADSLRAVGSVRTVMDGGVGGDAVSGGAAGDVIFSRDGERDLITCGAGIDSVRPDLRDIPLPASCENLDQSDRREDPNVAVLTRIARVDKAGVLNVRLACPRSVRIGCRGTLVARLDRPATRFGAKVAYSLRRGRSTVVAVALPAGQVAGARRPEARVRVRSVEAGVHGPKTTQRSLAARVG